MRNSQGSDADGGELEQLRDPELWTGAHYELALAMPVGGLKVATRLHLLTALRADPHLRG